MSSRRTSRRKFVQAVGVGALLGPALKASGPPSDPRALPAPGRADGDLPGKFLIGRDELTLRFHHPAGRRQLSFANFRGTPQEWRDACRRKLAELLGIGPVKPGPVRRLRSIEHEGVRIEALVMQVEESLSIPAYLLSPLSGATNPVGVLAIHGHGEVEPAIGNADEYHRRFALRLAQAGRTVLAPELRGFGTLRDVAVQDGRLCLDYWNWTRGPQFTLVTDAFLHGRTLVGETTEDLQRWEAWWADQGMESFDVAGISYGGDLCLTFPAFSERVRRIFCSGSFGSFSAIFSLCYNAPAHCVPHVLPWLDRSDIAGLSAPRPIAFHYGDQDVPSPENNSAAYNETVEPALKELRAIYQAFGAPDDALELTVTKGSAHVMDIDALKAFLGR